MHHNLQTEHQEASASTPSSPSDGCLVLVCELAKLAGTHAYRLKLAPTLPQTDLDSHQDGLHPPRFRPFLAGG
jgi:hypothetical protein